MAIGAQSGSQLHILRQKIREEIKFPEPKDFFSFKD
jgi:hypothetical protein